MKIFDIVQLNFKQLIRDKKNLFFLLLFPAVFMLIFGIGFGDNVESDIDIAIKLNKNYLDKNDVWNYFNEINKIKEMLYNKFQIKSDVFDLDSTFSLKDKIEKEVLYV